MDSKDLVLVTGASGYVASHIIKQLLDDGRKVRGTVRSLSNEEKVKPLRALVNADKNLQLVEADLLKEDSWKDAVKGCKYVIHVASPFPNVIPSDPEAELIKPAVDGTLSVLKACSETPEVKRVVLTSSIVAIYDASIPLPEENEQSKTFNEENWTNTEDVHLDTYAKSKALAEKAAWNFVKELPAEKKFELVSINPGLILGPLLTSVLPTSLDVVKRLLDRSVPAVAKLCLPICDVRDVAAAHIKALTVPEAAGHRHIVVTTSVWMREIAVILHKEFKPLGYSIPTMVAFNFMVWLSAFVDKTYKLILSRLSREFKFDTKRMTEVLGITPTDHSKTIIDTAHSLIDMGIVKKPKKSKKTKESEKQASEKVEETEDIKKEVKRAKKLRCVFCKKKGAASGCCIAKCKVSFHYPCGLENDILSQFKTPQYDTYCSEHRLVQNDGQLVQRTPLKCALCPKLVKSHLDPKGLTFVEAPCCHSLIHRDCLTRHASTKSIRNFKCPVASCKDVKKFVPEMQKFGIYIPEEVQVDKSRNRNSSWKDCQLCCSSRYDELYLGPKFQLDDLVAHYFCLLFACNLTEKDQEGVKIHGFLKEDIIEEIKRAKRLRCVFCKRMGAASGCCERSCRVTFHYPCGLDNEILSKFKDSYDMHCSKHRPCQTSLERLLQSGGDEDVKCTICSRRVDVDPSSLKFLIAPCCQTLIHRHCLQRLASSKLESTFCCPRCQNKEDFCREMLDFGIYVPEELSLLDVTDESSNSSFSQGSDSETSSINNSFEQEAANHENHLMDIGDNVSAMHRPDWIRDINDLNSTSTDRVVMEQEDEDRSMEDSYSSTSHSAEDACRKFDTAPFFPPTNRPTWTYASSRQSSLTDDSSDLDMSHVTAFIRKYPRMSESFSGKIEKKRPNTKSSFRFLQTARTSRGRKSTSIAGGSRNPLSPQEVNRFEGLKISKNDLKLQKLDREAGPSLNSSMQSQDLSYVDTTLEQRSEINNFCSGENSSEMLSQEAFKKAKERLSMALVQSNGRIFIKICKDCDYVTLAKGLSVYNHKEKCHPSSRKRVEELFKIEELKKEEAIEKMARSIMKLDQSQGEVKQANLANK
ncbi:uncharacterized protein LOC141858020 [Brevipalpus obovatus]|uniref:uncharacterized protein LOC141858020 n=1 Tax=Brevipalpus obovatus TaxID=246614 RepID=UPI003D9DDBD9